MTSSISSDIIQAELALLKNEKSLKGFGNSFSTRRIIFYLFIFPVLASDSRNGPFVSCNCDVVELF